MHKQKIDCLFLHTPENRPGGQAFAMYMSMGIFALADYLQRNGYIAKILHLGVEKILNNKFSIEDYLKGKEVRLVGISLHWHYQSRDTIKLVNKIKSVRPEIKIVLGGFTASFFADEIMKKFKNVDFVIRGDAEIPIVDLMREISKANPDFSSVPNLTWRKGNQVIHNEQNYVADEADINKLNFSNFKLMENFSTYVKTPLDLFSYSGVLLNKHNTFFLCVGRGCSVNCSFCGGSRLSHQIISARAKPVFRSTKNVLATIKDAVRAGIDCIYVSFDPQPKRNYYLELFRLIRIHKIDISLVFECWSLPTVKFIEEFKKTFGKGEYSKIVLSPETASERLRKLNKGFFYTNNELLNMLRYLKKSSIFTEIFFTYPLPYTTLKDVTATYNFIKLIKRLMGRCARILVRPFDLDPASPMFLYPVKYHIVKRAKHFSDYCNNKIKKKFISKDYGGQRLIAFYRKLSNMGAPDKLLYWGWTKFNLKQYRKVIKVLIKAIDKYRDAALYLLLGLCYQRIRRYEKAIEEFRKAKTMGRDEPQINSYLAYCYKKELCR